MHPASISFPEDVVSGEMACLTYASVTERKHADGSPCRSRDTRPSWVPHDATCLGRGRFGQTEKNNPRIGDGIARFARGWGSRGDPIQVTGDCSREVLGVKRILETDVCLLVPQPTGLLPA